MDIKKTAAVAGASAAGGVAGTFVAGPQAGAATAVGAGAATSRYIDNRRNKAADRKQS